MGYGDRDQVNVFIPDYEGHDNCPIEYSRPKPIAPAPKPFVFIPEWNSNPGLTIEYSRPKPPSYPPADLLDCTPSPFLTLWDDRQRLEELFPDKGNPRPLSARKAK